MLELIEAKRGLIFITLLLLGLAGEALWPLRPVTQSKSRRVARNLGLSIAGAIFLRLLFVPIVLFVSHETVRRGWGIVPALGLGKAASVCISILLLDYTLYIWHWINHVVPFFWRFHLVHHVDLDMDVSTAARFHFGELTWSVFYRSAQVIAFGIDPLTLILFETLVTSAAQFHHSNLYLPYRLEAILNKVIVTPRMHELHHSVFVHETNSNYSTIFSFWDRIHRSLSPMFQGMKTTIGVQTYRDDLNLWDLIALPFGKIKRQI